MARITSSRCTGRVFTKMKARSPGRKKGAEPSPHLRERLVIASMKCCDYTRILET
jgi:hypothetical protein